VQETAEYLGDYLNLYQIHSATFESGMLEDVRVHDALSLCRQQRGWKIGLSVSGPQQGDVLRAAMKVKSTATTSGHEPLFDSVQCTFNVLEQRPGAALLEAHQAGMDIIVKEGLANGRALGHPSILQYAQQLQCEPDQLALACILAQPFQPRVLSGAVTPGQLQSNFGALAVAERLTNDPSLLEEIMQSCLVNSEEYWKERSALPWN
jgi:aryl-alcohol dehydrogenase-like predicted oxidoreductase